MPPKLKLLNMTQHNGFRAATEHDITDEMVAAVERTGGANWARFQRDHPEQVARYLATKTLGNNDVPPATDRLSEMFQRGDGALVEQRRTVDRERQEHTAEPVDRTPVTDRDHVPVTSTWNAKDSHATKERLGK